MNELIKENYDKFIEKFRFMFDYLQEIDYELAEKIRSFVLDGTGEPELLLEFAVRISFNKAYASFSMILVNAYEYYMLEDKGYCLPYLLHSVRETITRNMVTVESNSSDKCLYLFKMSNGTVKIGIATDVKRRISQVEASSGMDVEKCLYTDVFEKAKERENELHRIHKRERKKGEFFSCSFYDIEKEITKIAKEENAELHYL